MEQTEKRKQRKELEEMDRETEKIMEDREQAGGKPLENNYEKQVEAARKLFLTYDQEGMAEKFHLELDTEYLYLEFVSQMFRISRDTGAVEYRLEKADGHYVPSRSFEAVMTLYDMLCYSKEPPVLAGEWCALHSLQVTMSSPSADTFTQKYADFFAGKTEKLKKVLETLGSRAPSIRAGADIWGQIPVFPFFPVQFRFWEEDEEFPSKIQLLWDRNSLRFLHFETLYYVQGYLMEKIKKMLQDENIVL